MDQGNTHPSDAALISRLLAGDECAFEELLVRHRKSVWCIVRRFLGSRPDAEDAIQEVHVRVYLSLKRFNPKFTFDCWIRRIAVNLCIDYLRRGRRRPYRLWSELSDYQQDQLMDVASSESGPRSRFWDDNETVERMARSLLAGLRPGLRLAFVLHKLQDWDYPAISKSLGISETSVRVRVHRARAEMQRRYRNHLSTRRTAPEAVA